jgi:hypothetical protein
LNGLCNYVHLVFKTSNKIKNRAIAVQVECRKAGFYAETKSAIAKKLCKVTHYNINKRINDGYFTVFYDLLLVPFGSAVIFLYLCTQKQENSNIGL